MYEEFYIPDFLEDEEDLEIDEEDLEIDEEDLGDYCDSHVCYSSGSGYCDECGAPVSGSFADHDLFWY